MSTSQREKQYDEIINLCYECILDNTAWPVLLNKILAATGRQQGVLTLWGDGPDPQASSIFQCDPATITAFNDYYCRIDLTREYMDRKPNAIWYHDHEKISSSIIHTHPFYQDFLRPFGYANLSCLKISGTDGDAGSYLTLLRNIDARAPSSVEQQLLQRLAPHLLRAGRLSAKLQTLTREIQQRDTLLDNSPTPAWLIDPDGRLIYCNRAAEDVLRSLPQLLTIKEQQIISPRHGPQLQGLLKRAMDPGHAGILPLEAHRQLLLLPLSPRDAHSLLRHPLVMMTLLQKPSAPILAQLFQLTPAEHRLATLLAQGLRPDECADTLCVSINTVRSQLRMLFSKTGTSRQSDLIALIHRLATLTPNAQNHSNG